MQNKINFTKKNLTQLKVEQKRYVVYDSKSSYLRVTVFPSGNKSFQVQKRVNGKPVTITLGKFCNSDGAEIMSVEQARARARAAFTEMEKGINPIEEKRAKKLEEERKKIRERSITLHDVFNEYLKVRGDLLSDNTLSNYRGIMKNKFTTWQDLQLKNITRKMVQEFHEEQTKKSPTSANKSMRLLRALYTFAGGYYEDEHGESLFPSNPVSKLTQTRSWNKETRRNTRLLNDDIANWFNAVHELKKEGGFSSTVADFLVFVLLTGMRRREASNLRWDDVNLGNKSFLVTHTKNGNPLELPLSDYLYEILLRLKTKHKESEFVFPATRGEGALQEPRFQIRKVREKSNTSFTLHDLRRTFITAAEGLNIPHYTLKRLLNHNLQGDVTAGYIVMDIERLREPMEMVTNHFLRLAKIPK